MEPSPGAAGRLPFRIGVTNSGGTIDTEFCGAAT
ncbi:hypothetical protein J2S41_003808 [Catenuloplanes atrovinosus]|uniref:Uncharacterized protein n=1 Tax=Catenuloplanes atrovinosus TaxID=137266 RepID=A0AAE3YQW7_9ACTN|nr:hypothetical protein [Catenuloplanes atrovinosus]